MSVSLGPYTSSADDRDPRGRRQALQLLAPRRAVPVGGREDRPPWRSPPSSRAGRSASPPGASLWGVLKTHFFTGSTIFFAAAHDTSGIFASSTFGTIARVLPVMLGPTTATTRSFLISRSTAVTAFVASDLVVVDDDLQGAPEDAPGLVDGFLEHLHRVAFRLPEERGGTGHGEDRPDPDRLRRAGCRREADDCGQCEQASGRFSSCISSCYPSMAGIFHFCISQSPLTIFTMTNASSVRPVCSSGRS